MYTTHTRRAASQRDVPTHVMTWHLVTIHRSFLRPIDEFRILLHICRRFENVRTRLSCKPLASRIRLSNSTIRTHLPSDPATYLRLGTRVCERTYVVSTYTSKIGRHHRRRRHRRRGGLLHNFAPRTVHFISGYLCRRRIVNSNSKVKLRVAARTTSHRPAAWFTRSLASHLEEGVNCIAVHVRRPQFFRSAPRGGRSRTDLDCYLFRPTPVQI